MEIHLLYKEKNFTDEDRVEDYMEDVSEDLELDYLYEVMSGEDKNIRTMVKKVLLSPLNDEQDIYRRQEIIKDCLKNKEKIHRLYDFLGQVLDRNEENNGLYMSSPTGKFENAVQTVKKYHKDLYRLREIAEEYDQYFTSEGFKELWMNIRTELDEEFLSESGKLLSELEFRDGMLVEMQLDGRNQTKGYRLLRKNNKKIDLKWKLSPGYSLLSNDMAGVKDLYSRKDRATVQCVSVLENASKFIEKYFLIFYRELGFYMGIVHLAEILDDLGVRYVFPNIVDDQKYRSFADLKNIILILKNHSCVGNTLNLTGKKLILITGANQGGKTKLLQSIGQAQLMMQSGIFVMAQEYNSHLCEGIYTHFKREEDQELKSGKLDEELRRLNRLIPHLKSGSLILFNESFSSTNEMEGSQLCLQISAALKESGIEQIHVTHLYDFARKCECREDGEILFLKADRREDGSRTYRIEEGLPEKSAYGRDIYEKVWKDIKI